MAGLGDATQALLGNIADAITTQTRTLEESLGDIQGRRDSRRAPFSSQQRGEVIKARKAAESEAMARAENSRKIHDASVNFGKLSSTTSTFQETFLKLATDFRDSNIEMGAALKEQIDASIDLAHQGGVTEEHLVKLNSTLAGASRGMDKVAVMSIKEAKATNKFTLGLMKAEDAIKDFATATFSVKGSLAQFAAGAAISSNALQESLKRQTPLLDSTAGSLTNLAAMSKLSATELMSSTSEYSSMLLANAKDGSTLRSATEQYLGSFAKLRDQAFNLTGSFDDANKLVMSSFEILSRSGLDMTFEKMEDPAQDLMKSMKTLSRMTNLSAKEIAQSTKVLMDDTVVRNAMLQLDKKDRAGYVNRLLQDQQMFIARGMEIEQAQEAVKALKSIAGQDPREKLKEAARMAAVASSMGIEGGQEMIKLAMIPQKRWSTEQTEAAQKFATNLKAAQQKGLGSDNFGKQTQTFALMQKMQGGAFNDIIMSLETAGKAGKEISDETTGAVEDNNSILSGIQGALVDAMKFFQFGEAFFKDPGAMLLTGSLGLVAHFATNALLLGRIALNTGGFGKLIKGLGSTLTGLASGIKTAMGAMTGTVNKLGAAGGITGKLAKGAGVLGAATFGWEAGKAITDYWKDSDPVGYQEASMGFGKMIDEGLSFLGNDAAKERLEMWERLDKQQEESNIIQRDMVKELKKGNEKTDLSNSELKKVNDSQQKGNELQEKQSQVERVKLRQFAQRTKAGARNPTM